MGKTNARKNAEEAAKKTGGATTTTATKPEERLFATVTVGEYGKMLDEALGKAMDKTFGKSLGETIGKAVIEALESYGHKAGTAKTEPTKTGATKTEPAKTGTADPDPKKTGSDGTGATAGGTTEPKPDPKKVESEPIIRRVAKAKVKGAKDIEEKYFKLGSAARQASIDGDYELVWVWMKDGKVVKELTPAELDEFASC